MEDFLGSIPQSNFHCIWCRGGANYLYSHAGEFFHFLAISTIWYIFWALAISTAYGGEALQTIYIHTLVSRKEVRGGNALNSSVPTLVFDLKKI